MAWSVGLSLPSNAGGVSNTRAMPGTAGVALSGQIPTVNATANQRAQPAATGVFLVGQQPRLSVTGFVARQAGAGAMALAGQSPSVISSGNTNSVVTLALSSASSGNQPWTFGQAFRQGDVPAGQFITAVSGAASSQADVRNHWSDGSVKYAVLSGVSNFVSGAASVVVGTTGTAPPSGTVAEPTSLANTNVVLSPGTGSFPITTGATYSINSVLGIDRSTWSRGSGGRVRQILGHVMSEFHYYQPTSDAHLAIWWFVRVYASGAVEIEVVLENGWMNVASPGEKDYTIAVNINGTTVVTYTNLTHFHHTRWSGVYWYSGGSPITPTHDIAYLRSTKLIPNYGFTAPSAAAFSGLASAINPLPFAQGNWSADMGSTGDQGAIGVLSHWESVYGCSADSRAYAATISNTRGHGRWPVHYRDETTGRVPLHQTYPNTTFTSGWGTAPPTPSGGQAGNWDIAHSPSVGYLSYLLEGRWTYLEALQFTSMVNILEANPGTRVVSGFGSGIIACINSPITTRGAAWSWRTAGQAASLSPKLVNGATPAAADLAVGDSFRTAIDNTMSWHIARYVNGTLSSGLYQNSVGWLGQYDNYTASPDAEATHFWGSAFMVQFQIAALAHISDLGIEGITQANLQSVRDFAYDGVVRLAGTDATWNFRRGALYAQPFLSNLDPSNPVFMTTPAAFSLYLSFNGLMALTSNAGDSLKQHNIETDMSGADTSADSTGYWAPVIANLATATEHGKAGASAAFTLVTAASNYNPVAHGINDDPKWAMRARSSSGALPSFVPAAGTFANVSLNTMSAVDPCPSQSCVYSGAGIESVFNVWNGGAYAANYGQYGALVCHGGGHNSYSGNAPFLYDIGNRTWACIGTPSPYEELSADSDGEYPDGRPFPPHCYSGLGYLSPANGGGTKGSLLRFGFAGSGDNEWVHRCDLTTGVWSRWSNTFLTGGSYFTACYDPTRNRHWYCAGYESFFSGHGYIDSTTGLVHVLSNLGDNADGANHTMGYCPVNDTLVALGTQSGVIMLRGRLASSSVQFNQLTTSGIFPPDPNAGLEWSTLLQCFVSYYGNGSATVYKLTPPATSPLTNAWVWSSQTLTGAGGATPVVANYPSGFNGQWSRFREVPALRCFIYADGKDNPVQLWRLSGM